VAYVRVRAYLVLRHSALTDPDHPFYQAQSGPGVCTHEELLENIEIHEGMREDECCSSHWSQGRDYLAGHPINPVVEATVSHAYYVQTAEEFEDDVMNWISTRVQAVTDATIAEPWNKHWCAVVFGGYECP